MEHRFLALSDRFSKRNLTDLCFNVVGPQFQSILFYLCFYKLWNLQMVPEADQVLVHKHPFWCLNNYVLCNMKDAMKCIKSDYGVDKEVRHEALVLQALEKWVPVISISGCWRPHGLQFLAGLWDWDGRWACISSLVVSVSKGLWGVLMWNMLRRPLTGFSQRIRGNLVQSVFEITPHFLSDFTSVPCGWARLCFPVHLDIPKSPVLPNMTNFLS